MPQTLYKIFTKQVETSKKKVRSEEIQNADSMEVIYTCFKRVKSVSSLLEHVHGYKPTVERIIKKVKGHDG